MYRVHPCFLVSQQTALITKVSGRGSIKILDPFYSGSCLHWGMVVMTFACCRGGREADNSCSGRKNKRPGEGIFFAHYLLGKKWRGVWVPSICLCTASFCWSWKVFVFVFLDQYNWTCNVLAASDCYNKWPRVVPKQHQGCSSRSQTSNTDSKSKEELCPDCSGSQRQCPLLRIPFRFHSLWCHQVLSHCLPHSLAPLSLSGTTVTVWITSSLAGEPVLLCSVQWKVATGS